MKLLKMGHGFASAAAAIGIARSSLIEWRHDDPVFRAECDMATEHCADLAEHELLRRGMRENDTLALLAWLRAHRPERYHRRQLVQVEGSAENPLAVEHTLVARGDDARVRFYMPSNNRDRPPTDDEPLVIEGEIEDDAA